jgi:hypothetical protein
LRSAGWLACAFGCALAGGSLLDGNGDAVRGVPGVVPGTLITAALFGVLLGAFGMLRAGQMALVAARYPWMEVEVRYEEIAMSTPNGQPILTLRHESQTWILTPATLVWRWRRFGSASTLLLAARPGRSGMIATTDRRNIAWAGRSIATKYLLWRRDRRG